MGYLPGWVVIETTGRRTGRPHRVPVGGGVRDGSVWVVAGRRDADYVRNIEARPSVRVRVHGRWRKGIAHVLPEDDPRRRALRTNPANGLFVAVASAVADQVTIRIDLEPIRSSRGA
jgi:deazaflavin-dependent oxidoreductase (nitroreductase family)